MAATGTVGILRALLTADASAYAATLKKSADATKAFGSAVAGAGTTAQKVTPQLTRLEKSFQGDKLLYTANNLTKAITNIGGAAKLTASEQARVNRTLTEAIDKYRALGQQAPKAMIDLEAATRRADVTASGFKDRFSTIGLAVGAVSGAVAGLAVGLNTLGARGADVADVREQFTLLTEAIGQSGDDMLTKLQSATLGTISKFEIMKTVNQGLSQGLKLTTDQITHTADVAAVLADRIGIDTSQAFTTLMQVMATGQDRQLKTIGLNIDAAKATEEYAASIGKATKDLDEQEKKQAIVNAVLAEGERVLKQSGKAQADFGDAVGKSHAQLSNFVDSIGAWVATTPSVAGWATAITTVSSTVTALALAFGPLKAGVMAVIPLFSAAGLAGAVSMATTAIGSMAAALTVLAPFLLPAGAIVVGIGAVYLAFKYWDDITRIAKSVYDGVKTWLVDKFAAVVKWIGEKVAAVTGFFKDLYDQVIGHSFVPDLIRGIQREFGRLDEVMVTPTQQAVGTISAAFHDLVDTTTNALGHGFADMIVHARSFKEAFVGIWRSIQQSITAILGDLLDTFLNSFLRRMLAGGGGGGLGNFAAGVLPFLGGAGGAGATTVIAGTGIPVVAGTGPALVAPAAGAGFGATIAGLATNPFTWAAAGGLLLAWGIGKKGWLRGGEEGTQVNPARDRFLRQFGPPGTGEGSGFHTLAALLTSLGGGRLFTQLRTADTMREFNAAAQGIVTLLSRRGIAPPAPPGRRAPSSPLAALTAATATLPGGSAAVLPAGAALTGQAPVTMNVTIQAWDRADMSEAFRTEIIPRFKDALQLNQQGLRTAVQGV